MDVIVKQHNRPQTDKIRELANQIAAMAVAHIIICIIVQNHQ